MLPKVRNVLFYGTIRHKITCICGKVFLEDFKILKENNKIAVCSMCGTHFEIKNGTAVELVKCQKKIS